VGIILVGGTNMSNNSAQEVKSDRYFWPVFFGSFAIWFAVGLLFKLAFIQANVDGGIDWYPSLSPSTIWAMVLSLPVSAGLLLPLLTRVGVLTS
jgi:hypothetical protein